MDRARGDWTHIPVLRRSRSSTPLPASVTIARSLVFMQNPQAARAFTPHTDAEQPEPAPCDSGYTCICPTCAAERAARAERSVQAPPRQPWQQAA